MRTLTREEIHVIATQMILGASESVKIAANVGFGFAHTYSMLRTEDVISLADSRLRLLAVLGVTLDGQDAFILPNSPHKHYFRTDIYKKARERGWNIRQVHPFRGEHFILVDNEIALVSYPGEKPDTGSVVLHDSDNTVIRLHRQFEKQREQGVDLNLIYEDFEDLKHREEVTSNLLTISAESWDNIIRLLARNPQQLYEMDPRKFEELVAELLDRQGLRVILTPRAKDGGKDILAFAQTPLGEHLYHIECKRYASSHPVGVTLVRQLYGVVEADRATAGMIVTTSRFTKDAFAFQETVKNRMSLKAYEDIISWINS
jgi:HJR/Mrr/RecB family endonuclease